ncbi:MAG: FtsX-like permease family protein [Clostridium sp.]
MNFEKMIINGRARQYGNYNIYTDEIKKSLEVIEKNNYKYGFLQQITDITLLFSDLDLDYTKFGQDITKLNKGSENVRFIGCSNGMLENYSKNIEGNMDFNSWNRDGKYIPVIIGSDFKGKIDLGYEFIVDNKKYKIVAYFKKDILGFDKSSSVNSSFLFNSTFVIPLSNEEYFENFQFEPITIFFGVDKRNGVNRISDEIKEVSEEITLSDFENDLGEFLQELKVKKHYEIIRILIVTVLATTSIITTISYKINEDKDKIGILYSVGIGKRNIFYTFSIEFYVNIFIGIIGGSLFYLKECKDVYAFFINENLLFNLYVGIILLLIITSISILTAFVQINRLTPREMVGGFSE